MGRRARTTLGEDLVAWAAGLPWWWSVLLAIGSLLLFSVLTSVQFVGGSPVMQVLGISFRGMAIAGQIVVPLLFLAGAVVSAFKQSQRTGLIDKAGHGQAADVLDGMHWKEFERLVGEAFRRQGYRVVESGGGGADGGVDLALSKPGQNGTEKTLVQCKHWRAYKVGVDVVRELYGVMAARGAAAGIVVTSGQFTAEAQAFAQGRNVRLIDGPALRGLVREVRAEVQGIASRHTSSSISPAAGQDLPHPDPSGTAPACPACGKPMVQRTARRGARPGSRFWGCEGYPACRGTRSLEER